MAESDYGTVEELDVPGCARHGGARDGFRPLSCFLFLRHYILLRLDLKHTAS